MTIILVNNVVNVSCTIKTQLSRVQASNPRKIEDCVLPRLLDLCLKPKSYAKWIYPQWIVCAEYNLVMCCWFELDQFVLAVINWKLSTWAELQTMMKLQLKYGIRLRVRAEYCHHDAILNQNVLSIKQDPLEKQFDLFSQSNTVLKSRDLGSIICDIKFSELSYLDAFWTDYMNGSLLEALKGVFITDSLKEAVGQETIQLLVNVDEDDYEEGRRMLLESFPQRAD